MHPDVPASGCCVFGPICSWPFCSNKPVNARDHWEKVYQNTAPNAVSWYRPHLETSLELIRLAADGPEATILDVGGGESTLVEDLIASGYRNLAVLDVSATALEVAKKRAGAGAGRIRWIEGDVTALKLPRHSIDVWHDRAVFHFLTEAKDREAYVQNLLYAVRPGEHVIIGIFGPDGPVRCSGLPVVRYDAGSLLRELGGSFVLVESREELHLTPRGITQQFVYCHFRVMAAGAVEKA
jgi:SAM-dependent methyltransferase